MHNPVVGTTAMDPDNHMAHDTPSYGSEEHWVDISPYHQQPTTMAEYGSFYAPNIAPMPPTHQSESDGLQREELSRMPPPPPPAVAAAAVAASQARSHQHHTPSSLQHHSSNQTSHHNAHPHTQLPMLITPGLATWPSMITNPASGPSYSASSMSITPGSVQQQAQAPPPLPTKPPKARSGAQPRRTLTDEDRRNMCLYHEENPHVKQSDIGQKFHVERSTVSKVLRFKEKFLFPDDKSTSPIKRPKGGKNPDVERTLSQWVRNQKKNGKLLTDEEILEKARFFSASVGNDNTTLKTPSSNWLEKFKQKNGIGPGRLIRRASEANIPDSVQLASGTISSLAPDLTHQTSSPTGTSTTSAQISPLSAVQSDENKDRTMSGMFDFGASSGGTGSHSTGGQSQADSIGMPNSGLGMGITKNAGAYKHVNHSTTSLQTCFTDAATSATTSSSYSALSPSTPFTFSPDPNSASAFPDPNFQRPRSQTFPTLDIEFATAPPTANEPPTPKYATPSTAPHSALESPGSGNQSFANLGATLTSPPTVAAPHVLHRSSSSGSIRGRAITPSSVAPAAGGSYPGSPTQDDARKAAKTLLSFIQGLGPGSGSPVDEIDLQNLLRLTDKLRLPTGSPQQPPSALSTKSSTIGLGGLSRIPETEIEMGNVKSAEPMT